MRERERERERERGRRQNHHVHRRLHFLLCEPGKLANPKKSSYVQNALHTLSEYISGPDSLSLTIFSSLFLFCHSDFDSLKKIKLARSSSNEKHSSPRKRLTFEVEQTDVLDGIMDEIDASQSLRKKANQSRFRLRSKL
jgi:hypothetical protein